MDLLSDFAAWLLDVLLYIPKKVFQWFLEALAGLLNSIPVPSFVSDVSGWIAGIPSTVTWALEPLQLGTGLALVGTAYTLRFLIRRIPFIG